ncbi:1-(5-phosphoribosyl)-5-[(5-phosphoribosylamino)methylideneamino]imidazole-4-carboxamide isomerase [Zavarzinia sp. CC-PAN008]|uniref:1-(5-phosphoribosyl)-5-[(5- phosphoribosylamino)methylideneamino]imidazole-4- carboxamide isomerase n=1 Tax=Zavarzinia sp. CC-PAN008 TaxID=3243332 RepID=UPI003F745DDB
MILYPAIDLKDGAIVRLLHGDFDAITRYGDDPAAQAATFAQAGFTWLHMVDLDGAKTGQAANAASVRAVLAGTSGLKLQLGGGIRSLATVETWLAAGVARVVLGSVAVRDPDLVRAACHAFPGQVALGIDAKGGRVAVQGWTETTDVTVVDLARRFEDAGAAAVIYTDIGRDGALTGPDVDGTAALAQAVAIPVIASGGVSSVEDLVALKGRGIPGCIIGRALYDGRIEPRQALERMAA